MRTRLAAVAVVVLCAAVTLTSAYLVAACFGALTAGTR